MAVEKDLELLDDYLSNRLNQQERTAFEKKMEENPELNREFKLQQNLVEGIRQTRIAELKAMLNQVPIGAIQGGQTAVGIKIASSIIVAGLITTAVYLYFSNDSPVEPQQPTEEVTEISEPENSQSNEPTNEPEVALSEEIEKPSSTTPELTPAKPVKPGEVKPKLDVYDPSKEEENQILQKEREQIAIISRAFVTSSIEVEIDASAKKYNFHYAFKERRLILFGTFEAHLYEILEFIAEDKRTVFLYYKSNYYLLDEHNQNPTPLVPIRDQKLIKKLKEFRLN